VTANDEEAFRDFVAGRWSALLRTVTVVDLAKILPR